MNAGDQLALSYLEWSLGFAFAGVTAAIGHLYWRIARAEAQVGDNKTAAGVAAAHGDDSLWAAHMSLAKEFHDHRTEVYRVVLFKEDFHQAMTDMRRQQEAMETRLLAAIRNRPPGVAGE